MILQVSNLSKYFGERVLFKNLSFSVNEKERLAVIGANGCGKSTLLKILISEEEPSKNRANEPEGSVAFAKCTTIGYLSQDVITNIENTLYDEALLVFSDVIKLEHELENLTSQMALNDEDEKLHKKYSSTLEAFERKGGYDYRYLIDLILQKFGFKKEDFSRPIVTFSGGEKTKAAFAKLLLLKPDLLILDEPTNHLDISTIEWLENYLKSLGCAIIFVSHDRYFINSLANKIIEINSDEVTTFKGNYDQYMEYKKLTYEQRLKAYNIQQKEIEKLQRFITYFKPKPRFVSRAKDREKKLEHMEKLKMPKKEKKGIKFSFNGNSIVGKNIMSFENCVVGYDNKVLTSPFSFILKSDDRLAIMGDNGCGKTTLIRSILKEVKLLSGDINRLRELNIGYLKQSDFSLNGIECTVFEYFTNLFPKMDESTIRTHLGKFDFQGDEVFTSINNLSGGEKMRLMLAKLVLSNYDLLILDEPTNHLDLLTKESLISSLSTYDSALIFVSHDRYFVDAIANKILYIQGGKAYYHEGNYESFKEIESSLFSENAPIEEKSAKKENCKKTPSKNISIKKLEEKITILEGKLKSIKDKQFLEENYMDVDKMNELELEYKKISEELKKIEEEYLNYVE